MSAYLEPQSLLAKTAKGAGWVVCWRMATRVLGLISTLTLVHLLLPADFGLVALGTSLAQSVDALSYLGVQDAVIRAKNPDREMYDTAFTLNAMRGVLTAVLLAAAAYPAAAFFDEPRLAAILFALGIGVGMGGFENIGVLDFRRDFAFNREFQLLVVPRILGIVAGITFALIFVNYWALVVGIMTTRSMRLVFTFVMHPYRPRFGLRAWRYIFGFSFWTWIISLGELLRDRSDSLVIGRILNTVQVGIYSVGAEIAALPTTELVEPLCRACFSSFSAAGHAGASVSETYLRVISTTAILTLPAGIGISLVADPLVRLAFGARWLGAIPLVQILAVGGTMTLFGYISMTLFSAQALLGVNLRITIASMILRFGLLIVLVSQFGLVGGAIAAALSIVFEQTLYVLAILRNFHLRMTDLLRHTWRSLTATSVMAFALVIAGLGWEPTEGTRLELAGQLFGASALGAAIYTVVLLGLWVVAGRPHGAETDLLEMLRRGWRVARGVVRRRKTVRTAAGSP